MANEFPTTLRVLIFNKHRILALIAASVNEAARFSNLAPTHISRVCRGIAIAHNKYYFRYISDDIEIELSDIGSLTLEQYDKLCGVERKVYSTSSMRRNKTKIEK